MGISNDGNNCFHKDLNFDEIYSSYIPKWHEKRLPFIFAISFEFGSAMFDYSCIWNKDMFIFEVGAFWFHVDIYFKK